MRELFYVYPHVGRADYFRKWGHGWCHFEQLFSESLFHTRLCGSNDYSADKILRGLRHFAPEHANYCRPCGQSIQVISPACIIRFRSGRLRSSLAELACNVFALRSPGNTRGPSPVKGLELLQHVLHLLSLNGMGVFFRIVTIGEKVPPNAPPNFVDVNGQHWTS
jgi:hypothetical protein